MKTFHSGVVRMADRGNTLRIIDKNGGRVSIPLEEIGEMMHAVSTELGDQLTSFSNEPKAGEVWHVNIGAAFPGNNGIAASVAMATIEHITANVVAMRVAASTKTLRLRRSVVEFIERLDV